MRKQYYSPSHFLARGEWVLQHQRTDPRFHFRNSCKQEDKHQCHVMEISVLFSTSRSRNEECTPKYIEKFIYICEWLIRVLLSRSLSLLSLYTRTLRHWMFCKLCFSFFSSLLHRADTLCLSTTYLKSLYLSSALKPKLNHLGPKVPSSLYLIYHSLYSRGMMGTGVRFLIPTAVRNAY